MNTIKREFCVYCGAGIGEHRREGEGTCMKCDPEGVKANMDRHEAASMDAKLVKPMVDAALKFNDMGQPDMQLSRSGKELEPAMPLFQDRNELMDRKRPKFDDPDDDWQCICMYMNTGPICTHCGEVRP